MEKGSAEATFSPTYLTWRKIVEASLKGVPFERLVATTAEGIRIEPLHDRPMRVTTVARSRQPWTIAQRIDHDTAEAANGQALCDLANGAQGLTIVFDSAPSARGFGLASNIDTLARVLDPIALDGVSLRFDAGAAALPLATAFRALIAGRDLSQITVDFGIDPVGVLAATGQDMRSRDGVNLADLSATAREQGLAGSLFLADGRYFHEAGAGEAQELGYTLATAIEYLRHLESGGVSLAVARDQLAFLLVADADEFLTLAKFRALRLLWAKIEAMCGLSPKPARIHAETAYRMMSRRDPWVNVMRSTVASFSAGLAGADVVTILPFTAALGLADEAARRLARNTQLILIEEANLARVIDPASGAGSFETLTQALCEHAWVALQGIERVGSMTAALRAGQVQRDIAKVQEVRRSAIAFRRLPITGTSDFPDLHEGAVCVLRQYTPKQHRNVAPSGQRACQPLPSQRDAEPYEFLRDAADAYAARVGRRPQVFVACLGQVSVSTNRASFVKNLFEAGGLEVPVSEGFGSAEAAVRGFARAKTTLACLCGSDNIYAELGVDTAAALKTAGAKHVYLAGRPKQLETALKEAGVGTFLQADCDALSILRAAHAILGLQEFRP